MLGLGFWELFIVGLIALIVVGPERLPGFARELGRFLNDLKRTASELKSSFNQETDVFKKEIDSLQSTLNHEQLEQGHLPQLDASQENEQNQAIGSERVHSEHKEALAAHHIVNRESSDLDIENSKTNAKPSIESDQNHE